MMRVYVTGISGFVGANLSQFLSDDQFDVRPLNLRRSISARDIQYADAVVHLAGKAHDMSGAASAEEFEAVNAGLTKQVFDLFLSSEAHTFIFLSSVKAVKDAVDGTLTENTEANPSTAYGRSKRNAEKYILSQTVPASKRVYILRPCMIHGPGNKGNLNLLYKVVSKKIPWPLGSFENKRSFLSVGNLCFVISQLLKRNDIPAGIYNVADSEPISTSQLITTISAALGTEARILNVPKNFIRAVARIGDLLHLSLDSERLRKLSENYVVSNVKLLKALGSQLPGSTIEGIKATILSFGNQKK